MTSIYLTAIFSGIGFISLCFIIRYLIKTQRKDKDFFFAVITCGFFTILTFYLVTTSVIDIFYYQTGHLSTAEGICEIYFFESGHRSPSRYDIWIDDLGLTADSEDFSYLKEETTACKVTYLKATGTLIDIDLN